MIANMPVPWSSDGERTGGAASSLRRRRAYLVATVIFSLVMLGLASALAGAFTYNICLTIRTYDSTRGSACFLEGIWPFEDIAFFGYIGAIAIAGVVAVLASAVRGASASRVMAVAALASAAVALVPVVLRLVPE